MSEIEEEGMNERELAEKIVGQLKECSDLLMACELDNKSCILCRKKGNCRKFIRSILAAVCRLQVTQMSLLERSDILETMFV